MCLCVQLIISRLIITDCCLFSSRSLPPFLSASRKPAIIPNVFSEALSELNERLSPFLDNGKAVVDVAGRSRRLQAFKKLRVFVEVFEIGHFFYNLVNLQRVKIIERLVHFIKHTYYILKIGSALVFDGLVGKIFPERFVKL